MSDARRVPVWLSAHEGQVPGGDGWLTPVERRAQARYTVPRRRDDWRLGRWTAKATLAAWCRLHRPDVPCPGPGGVGIVQRGPEDGFPLVQGPWEPAPSLSLTHRDGVAVACVAEPGEAVGCDLERVEARPARFATDWFRPEECERIDRAPRGERDLLVTLTWSAKEGVLKAVGEGLRMDTRVVRTDLPGPPGTDGWGRVSARLDGAQSDGAHLDGAQSDGDRPDGAGPGGAARGIVAFGGWWRRLGPHVLVIVTALRDTAGAAGPAGEGGPPRRMWPGGAQAGRAETTMVSPRRTQGPATARGANTAV